MALVRSLGFSLLASVLATALARRLLSVSELPARDADNHAAGARAVVVVVPIVSGNSNNRIGYVKEVHHHPLFRRARR